MATPVDVRVVASVGAAAPVVASAATTVTTTHYAYCAQPDAKQAWSIIGQMGPGQDWSTDYVMTYDCAAKTFSYTNALKVGEYKFRYGADWTANLGGPASTGGALAQDGPNLKITTAGTYTIVLMPAALDPVTKKATTGSFTIK